MSAVPPQPAPSQARAKPILELASVERHYTDAAGSLTVLDGADLIVYPGELVALAAPSGAGKSTLLHIAGLLERPDGGDVIIGGRAAGSLNDADRTALRRTQIGFVYQFHHLLGEFSASENVAMPLLIRGLSRREATLQADRMLALVGLAERKAHRPGELSGGERQRVALARALVTEPSCVLADEPTGNLDVQTAREMFALLKNLARQLGTAVVIVTHDLELASRTDRPLALSHGMLKPVRLDPPAVSQLAGAA